jgi:hypothetical protein
MIEQKLGQRDRDGNERDQRGERLTVDEKLLTVMERAQQHRAAGGRLAVFASSKRGTRGFAVGGAQAGPERLST